MPLRGDAAFRRQDRRGIRRLPARDGEVNFLQSCGVARRIVVEGPRSILRTPARHDALPTRSPAAAHQ